MATARKPYVRLETSLYREACSLHEKTMLMMLIMLMGDRWARDRLTAEEACHTTLSHGDLVQITGKKQFKVASNLIQTLSNIASISIEVRGEFVLIYWPKLAETQEWASRGREFKARRKPESAPAPAPAPAKTLPEQSSGAQSASPDPSPPKPKYPPEAAEATRNLIRVVQLNIPGQSVPDDPSARFDKWCVHVDRLERLDNGKNWTWGEINALINWLEGAKFWSGVIRSTANLREHFAMMMTKKRPKEVSSVDAWAARRAGGEAVF